MEDRSGLAVTDLCYAYERGRPVLRGVSARFAPGKITALIGANGCGKSTLLNLLAGIFKPDSGQVLLDGRELGAMKRPAIARRIAVVHQSNAAPGDLTVEKLVYAGRTPYRGLLKPLDQADEAAVRQAMADTDTGQFAHRPISALSGGQLQRVWLAMALAQQADILLLDEVTTYLDIHYQLEMLHLIAELNRKKRMTILMVLHDINQAFAFCDEVVILKGGEVMAQGEIDQVVQEPVLSQAFEVASEIITVAGRKHCLFHRQGGDYG